MQREREMNLKLENERRRIEQEFAIKERIIEDRTKEVIRQNEEKMQQEDEYRRREHVESIQRILNEEKHTIESEFNDQRTRLERAINEERNHERKLLETTKRER